MRAAAPPGPGLARVKKLYASYGPGEGIGDPNLMADVVRTIEKHPEEEAAILAYMETYDGPGAGSALARAREEEKRKNGVRLKGGALDLGNPLAPRLGIKFSGSVTKKKDNEAEKQLDNDQVRDAIAAQAHNDPEPDTVIDWVSKQRSGPPQKAEQELRNEDKFTIALEEEKRRKAQTGGGTPDAGSPPGIRKRDDD